MINFVQDILKKIKTIQESAKAFGVSCYTCQHEYDYREYCQHCVMNVEGLYYEPRVKKKKRGDV
ncbi:MAG: hypothetical protein DRI44_02590 [Chlamydiae bacterium]|nr:MAG: hypothetical protein DRI44_02590 [Chlamydiota bacterium]